MSVPSNTSPLSGSCSPFFLTGIFTSTVSGVINQVRSLKMAKRDIEFDKQVAEIKERYADYKAERDHAANLLKKQQKRQHKRDEVQKELIKDLNTAELKMFFRDWPLVLDINTIISGVGSTEAPSLYFIIARHNQYSDKDPLSLSYNNIVDLVKKNLRKLGITDDLVLTYKQKTERVGGPSVANCFALMQSIPTVMIMHSIGYDGKTIDFSVALWNQESRFPYNQRVFSFDYNKKKMLGDAEYKSLIEAKIVKATTTIAAVYNDCHRIIEYKKEASLPRFKDLFSLNSETVLKDFAVREYASLANTPELIHECKEINGAVDDSVSQDYIDSIGKLASAAVAAMK